MHIEYAADALVRMEAAKQPQEQQVKTYLTEKEPLKLAMTLGGKAADIAGSVYQLKHNTFGRTHKKVTAKQEIALTLSLLEAFGTARAVYAAAYCVSEEEFLSNAGK